MPIYKWLTSQHGLEMDVDSFVKTLHILSAMVLFGTGLGIAFFMFRSMFANSINEKRYAAKTTVLADYLFTFPAVIIQPISGAWLVWKVGFYTSSDFERLYRDLCNTY